MTDSFAQPLSRAFGVALLLAAIGCGSSANADEAPAQPLTPTAPQDAGPKSVAAKKPAKAATSAQVSQKPPSEPTAKQPATPAPTTKSAAKQPSAKKPASKGGAHATSAPASAAVSGERAVPATAVAQAEPAQVAPPAPEPPAPPSSVRVPSTEHVSFEVPSGLQHWLDEDDRMVPWLSRAVNVIDACYADVRSDHPNAAGVVTFSVRMHRTARPSADVISLPGPLQSIVRCATLRLMGVKMPLFTGTEGETYTVQAHFRP